MRDRPDPDLLCGGRYNSDAIGGPLGHRRGRAMAPGRCCGRGPLSRKVEDYLEAILCVAREKGYARTSDVAKELSVSPSSVVEMFQKLGHMGLVTYRRYEGVTLTPEGRSIAEVITGMPKWASRASRVPETALKCASVAYSSIDKSRTRVVQDSFTGGLCRIVAAQTVNIRYHGRCADSSDS